jgi:hypothetical protein
MDAVAHADTQGQRKSPVTHEKMKPTVSIGGKEMLNRFHSWQGVGEVIETHRGTGSDGRYCVGRARSADLLWASVRQIRSRD